MKPNLITIGTIKFVLYIRVGHFFLSQHDSVGLQGFELSVGLYVCVSVSVQFSKIVLCNI